MEQLAFRPARSEDAGALAVLINGAYRGTPDGRDGWTTESHLVEGQRITEAGLRELLGRGHGAVLVAERAGEVLGCVHLERGEDDACELGLLSVRVDAQAGGVGRALLAEAERFARDELGARRIVMHVVSVREDLLAWYERRGYRRTGERVPFRPRGGQRLLQEGLAFEVLEKDLV